MTFSLGMENGVLKMIGYGLKNRGSIPDRDRNVTPTSRPALGPIEHTIQRAPTSHTATAVRHPTFTTHVYVTDIKLHALCMS